MTSPAIPVGPELARRLSGSPLLVMLDIDGTLSPIAMRPDVAVVPQATKRVLAALAGQPGVQVALVSGRAAHDARRIVGVSGLWVVGNHGFEIVTPAGDERVNAAAAPYGDSIARAERDLIPLSVEVPGVLIENKRWTLAVHYRMADRAAISRIAEWVARVGVSRELRLTFGKETFELRPPLDIDKGSAAAALAESLGAFAGGASLLFAGDDRTDEDAFRTLRSRMPECVTVRVIDARGEPVGVDSAPTAAEFTLPDPEAVRELLEWIAAPR